MDTRHCSRCGRAVWWDESKSPQATPREPQHGELVEVPSSVPLCNGCVRVLTDFIGEASRRAAIVHEPWRPVPNRPMNYYAMYTEPCAQYTYPSIPINQSAPFGPIESRMESFQETY